MRLPMLDTEQVWPWLLALKRLSRTDTPLPVTLDAPSGSAMTKDCLRLERTAWHCPAPLTEAARQLLALYLPLFQPRLKQPYVVAHLGQSLDGCIAARDGGSIDLNDSPNIDHLHRLRALSDAILVGAGTVAADNPQLTTRRVPGDHPIRVILDPRRRLDGDYRLFHDTTTPTVLVCLESCPRQPAPGRAELLPLPGRDDRLDLSALLIALQSRGLKRLFVEGGGITVSRFLQAGLLDRLQITVAPIMLGCGRSGLQLPGASDMQHSLRPASRRFDMGRDVLFDFDLRGADDSLRY